MTDENGLTKVTVNVIPSAMAALDAAAARSGDTKTDTINRALQWYDHSTRPLLRHGYRWSLTFLGCLLPSQLFANLTDVAWQWDVGVLGVSALAGLFVASWLNWRPR